MSIFNFYEWHLFCLLSSKSKPFRNFEKQIRGTLPASEFKGPASIGFTAKTKTVIAKTKAFSFLRLRCPFSPDLKDIELFVIVLFKSLIF